MENVMKSILSQETKTCLAGNAFGGHPSNAATLYPRGAPDLTTGIVAFGSLQPAQSVIPKWELNRN